MVNKEQELSLGKQKSFQHNMFEAKVLDLVAASQFCTRKGSQDKIK